MVSRASATVLVSLGVSLEEEEEDGMVAVVGWWWAWGLCVGHTEEGEALIVR